MESGAPAEAHPEPTAMPIGRVESPIGDLEAAPKQGDEGAPDAWILLDESVLAGAADLMPGDRILVLTWLDRASREVLQVHPRDDRSRPVTGVFSTRSADRPNPIGLHAVRIEEVDLPRIKVAGLEAMDGTPVLDIKPELGPPDRR